MRQDFLYQNYLSKTLIEVEVPIYFIHGIRSYVINHTIKKEYFEELKTSKRGFFTFENQDIFHHLRRLINLITLSLIKSYLIGRIQPIFRKIRL